MKSKIIEFIENNPSDWREKLNEKKVRVGYDKDFAIFNYAVGCDFFDPVVQEARGIIINLDKRQVVCWPFRKFGNIQEEYADEIDWNTAQVQEKIDGSIIKLWWDGYQWHWSTNACIDAFEAPLNGGWIENFGDLIESAVNYKDIDFNSLDKQLTYIFELVSPVNKIVIRYPITKLYHIGTRNNVTGEELEADIGIDKPKKYELNSREKCEEAAIHLNSGCDDVKYEGFVVVDKNYNRVKIKSPDYLMAHKLWNNGTVSKIDLIKEAISDLDVKSTTDYEVASLYYKFKIYELLLDIDRYISYVRNLYEEYSHDRKAVANVIKTHKLASFGFSAIGNNDSAKKILYNTTASRIAKLIPDYTKEKIYE